MKQNFNYFKDGLTIAELLNKEELKYLLDKVSSKILNDFNFDKNKNLKDFHNWPEISEDNRRSILSAKNRHFKNNFWNDIKLEDKCKKLIEKITNSKVKIWDEGLGGSAYRLIRPFFNDGYPPSRKSWGPGGNLISITIPIIGFTKFESQGFLVGSHLNKYESFLDKEQKFCSEERRLKDPEKYDFARLNISRGECIIFHWNTIHTEQIIGKNSTRLALELRYEAI